MRGKFPGACCAALVVLCGWAVAPAGADSITLKFSRVVDPLEMSEPDEVAGQLFVEVADSDKDGNAFESSNMVRFTFRNEVGVASSITGIYFDDGTLLGIDTLINDPDFTDFEKGGGATPPDLPGGDNLDPPFETTQGFLAGIFPNGPFRGIDKASERVHIYFELIEGQTYADVVNALYLGGVPGGLRVGLFVQAIGPNDLSASYVNVPVIPTPGAAVAGLALAGFVLCGRRRAV